MFRTTHNLLFETKPWHFGIQLYRIGTCEGQWFCTATAYHILSFLNYQPGNGHLTDVFEWFEHSARRDKRDLIIEEFFNDGFKLHCIEKHGFVEYEGDSLIKHFT